MAELYERARPSYPADAVAWLVSQLGLVPGRVVVDLAAGTGKLTRLLVPSGATIVAVEPLAEMLDQLRNAVPGVEAVEGTAEAMPLASASVDVVTVAQGFHWFDAEPALAEIARVLRPGGALALVWNVRDLEDELHARLNALLAQARGATPSGHEQPWRGAFEASSSFAPLELRSFPWEEPYTADQLADRISSISFVARLSGAERDVLLARVRELVAGLPEPFPFRYRTDVYVARRLGG